VKKIVIIATVAAVLLAVQAGGGWRSLANGVSDWLDGGDAASRAKALANANARDVGAGFAISPRAPGAMSTMSDNSARTLANTSLSAVNNDPNAQLAAAQERADRTRDIYENYRKQTVYPFDSRPAREHADQMYPNAPVVEDQKLKNPGQKPSQNIRLRTSQERVYAQGAETVWFTVAALDADGVAQPVAFTRAIAHDPPKDGKPSKRNAIAFPFNDDGANGDATANDFTYSARLAPAQQGFANFHGNIRVELHVKVAEQTGFLFFDVFYTPDPPAVWRGAMREALENGSLNFYLPIEVRTAGRYVVTARVDDAKGQPFALINFNDELRVGAKDVKLNLFGKLLVDEAPAFPLTIRDIDGFLLIPDADPDRALMSRLMGKQHVTRSYAPSSFSAAEWDSEERRRYLEEYGKDVESARRYLEHIRRSMKP
jgi:hypothetical protein